MDEGECRRRVTVSQWEHACASAAALAVSASDASMGKTANLMLSLKKKPHDFSNPPPYT